MSLAESQAQTRSLRRDRGTARCSTKADDIPVFSVCMRNLVHDMTTAIRQRETSNTRFPFKRHI